MTASTVRFSRIDPEASPSALVAAWLMDALSGTNSVRLSQSDAEWILLEVNEPDVPGPVRTLVRSALAEPRFAGWEVDPE